MGGAAASRQQGRYPTRALLLRARFGVEIGRGADEQVEIVTTTVRLLALGFWNVASYLGVDLVSEQRALNG
jgi:hypothetical protein